MITIERTSLAALGVAVVSACGGKVAAEDQSTPPATHTVSPKGIDVDCDRIDFAWHAETRMCLEDDRCTITGELTDGRRVRQECSGDGRARPWACTLFVDDVAACQCATTREDPSNTCANGISTCVGWRITTSDLIVTCDP
jgi:hypothetical protein